MASCTDCHNVHEIRARQDPESSIHPANVTETCGRCHEKSNPTFAQSYTHAGALKARGYHGIGEARLPLSHRDRPRRDGAPQFRRRPVRDGQAPSPPRGRTLRRPLVAPRSGFSISCCS